MLFPQPLTQGRLIRRYKRFLSDIEMADGTVVTAHVANSGGMIGLNEPGIEVWLSPASNPERKLRWSWELARIDGHLVGINTHWPNQLAAEAILAGRIPELAGYDSLRREVKYGRNSRIDLLLDSASRPKCYVEVKNVHLRRGCRAEFPDAVTARGTKHLAELSDMVAEGHRAVMLYLVQRGDCDSFRIAADIDPAYDRAFKDARKRGVEVLCHACDLTLDGIEVGAALPLDFKDD